MYRTETVKTIFFSFAILLASTLKVHAQIFSAANPTKKSKVLPKTYAGIKFGANFSYLSGSDWNSGIKSNMLGGAFAGIKGPGFGAQAEALFEQSDYTTGSNFYSLYKNYYRNINDSLKQGNFRVNKLCLPLLLQFRMARLFWLQAGVQFYGIVDIKDNNKLLEDARKIFRGGNTAGIIGSTIHFGNADMGMRIVFDFQQINKITNTDAWRQYMFQAHVGVKLF